MVMAEISKLLKKEDEKEFLNQAQMVKKAYNQTLLIKENGRAYYRSYDNGEITQANQALPLCFGMVPKECVKSVQAELLALCTDSHLKCGEIGLVYILRALSEMNQHEKDT